MVAKTDIDHRTTILPSAHQRRHGARAMLITKPGMSMASTMHICVVAVDVWQLTKESAYLRYNGSY